MALGILSNAASTLTMAEGLGAAFAALGTATNILEQHHADEAAEEYAASRMKIRNMEAQRRKQERLKQQRLERARVENVAAQTGTAVSSGAIGAQQDITSRFLANQSFLDVTGQMAGQATSASRREAEAKGRAEVGTAVASAAPKVAGMYQSLINI